MASSASYKNALTAVLFELIDDGIDVGKLVEKASGGLSGNKMYAPPGASEKPKSVEALSSGVKEARKYINIKVS